MSWDKQCRNSVVAVYSSGTLALSNLLLYTFQRGVPLCSSWQISLWNFPASSYKEGSWLLPLLNLGWPCELHQLIWCGGIGVVGIFNLYEDLQIPLLLSLWTLCPSPCWGDGINSSENETCGLEPSETVTHPTANRQICKWGHETPLDYKTLNDKLFNVCCFKPLSLVTPLLDLQRKREIFNKKKKPHIIALMN